MKKWSLVNENAKIVLTVILYVYKIFFIVFAREIHNWIFEVKSE